MQIVFVDESTITLDDMDFSCMHKLGDYVSFPNSTEPEIIDRCSDADYLIANKALMTRNIIENLPKLRMIAVIATGYNNVDLAAAKKKGVTVCNVAGYAAATVPQHTFALILNLATAAYKYNADVEAGKWHKATSFTLLTYPTFELAGKTIGIIGFGTIGRNVARIAEGFNMKILANDAFGINDPRYPNTDLDTIYKESDVITVHCPLTDETKNLIDAATIAKMKSNVLLINTARGGVVDEQALADALNSGRIAGAGFDVLTVEPPKDGNVLLGAKNLILTPHSAWSTLEARQILVDESARNIEAHSQDNPRNVVA